MATDKIDMDMLLNMGNKSSSVPPIPIVWNKIDMFMQEVDILFSTDSYSVLGAPHGWPDLKTYIFKTNVSSAGLHSKISELISTQCPTASEVDWDIEVGFVNGELHDIGVITLRIRVPEGADKIKDYYVG